MAGLNLNRVAFMRCAMKRSSSGKMVLSCFLTAYHEGFDLHAATVVLAVGKSVAAIGA